MFPNEARLRNMNYSMAIHFDVVVEVVSRAGAGGAEEGWEVVDDKSEGQKHTILRRVFPKVYLGKFPVMLQSSFCILHGMPREMRYNVGECRNDPGGYFIVDGKEKVVISQEKFADNALYVHNHRRDMKDIDDDDVVAETASLKPYLTTAEIRSVSENPMKPIRKSAIHLVAPTHSYKNRNIVVEIPNVRKHVPLFIVFRALGIISDKAIIEMCLLDIEKYESMMDLFIPSIYDAGPIYTQQSALQYITALTKYDSTPEYTLEILCDYFLPHIGDINFTEKAYYLGYMVFRLLAVSTGLEEPVDRDHYKHKRLELTGTLLHDLFREYYKIQCKTNILLTMETRLYYKQDEYRNNLAKLVDESFKDAFRERAVEAGFAKAYKGNWGATEHTKRIATIQDLDRISFHSIICHLRKTNLPLDSTSKVVGPRLLHSSQWGIVDPVDTPDGGNIGLLKTLCLSVVVSTGYSREKMVQWLQKHRVHLEFSSIAEHSPKFLSERTKVVINGYWAGVVGNPRETVDKIIQYRRFGLIPTFTSATFDIRMNTVFIYTDAGRLCRPTFHCRSHKSWGVVSSLERRGGFPKSWEDMLLGSLDFVSDSPVTKRDMLNSEPRIYSVQELYGEVDSETFFTHEKEALVDFMDSSETENALIATDIHQLRRERAIRRFTHLEIHDSLIFGYMCNHTIFPENNPVARNQFSCSQSRQAVSVYNSNYTNRMDKTGIVLTYGQIPLLKSRYLKYFSREEHPYGVNAIVAIMCYTGYNVEDAILLNEASVKRGMFQTNYYNTYYAHEETTKQSHVSTDIRFTNIDAYPEIVGTQPKADYSKLDDHGIIRENTPVDENTVVIGLSTYSSEPGSKRRDASVTPKKGQIGMVDKVFMTDDEEGKRIAKVRVRELRRPMLGDKMASRAGQKGTCGNIIPERDMPFTKDGLRPDLIINPHAIPTRMTIGQFVECIIGKVCVQQGAFGDCTAFNNKSTDPLAEFGKELSKYGYHSQGDEILYNGMTGEQLESSIFIGPTYYMRLKHMVKDKVNFRAQGPNTSLTRQPVSGRANDGGLRIGEMERDVLVSHGIQAFLQDSMMNRSDDYYFAVCNVTGMVAIYNPSKNLFMSPAADGPIHFKTTQLGEDDVSTGDVFVDKITRFGRSFSVVRVPYSFKLLLQELQTINVQMRIITEDNIDQFDALNLVLPEEVDKILKTKPEEVVEPKPVAVMEQEPVVESVGEEEEEPVFKYSAADEHEPVKYEEGSPKVVKKPILPTSKERIPLTEEEISGILQRIDPRKSGLVTMHWRGDEHDKRKYSAITNNVKNGNVTIFRTFTMPETGETKRVVIQNVSLRDLYLPSEYDNLYHPNTLFSIQSYKWKPVVNKKPEWAKNVLRWHIVVRESNDDLVIVPESIYFDNMEQFDTETPDIVDIVTANMSELEPVYPAAKNAQVGGDLTCNLVDVGMEEEEEEEEPPKVERKKQTHAWKDGDAVYYREDYAKPSRLWKVKHVSDDRNFITIETDDLDGIGVEDSVRIVFPEMIYDNTELISFNDLLGQTHVDTAGKVPGYLPIAQPLTPAPPVNVVVVTGDNSVGTTTTPVQGTKQVQAQGTAQGTTSLAETILSGNGLEKSVVVAPPVPDITPVQSGDIDFTKEFVITKIA
jgi:DNA-directed RNA polymerase II subunit RPB2